MSDKTVKKWINAGTTSVSNVLLMHYKAVGLTDQDLVVLIQLMSLVDQGQSFPDSRLLADRLNVSREEAYKAIHKLMTKKLVTIETSTDEEGITHDEFSFELLYDRLIRLLDQQDQQEEEETYILDSKELYRLFEQEFGRGLSAMEIQTLDMWLNDDQYAPELIELALREAVLSQVYSLKYIDRILLTWDKKNIRTKAQVEKETKRHRQQADKQQKDETDTEDKPVPMYNWLKEQQRD
ncbi:Chromosome replication initiation protein DnaD [Alkalibacterium sp. AK22]|uniref:DnaD domain-containing protein n=1 Tax=Alkalibacterium sp. AK22 TaxID=1229520 RepID=UPI000449D1E6|nr:DnaD domain-containing protein [Alkalibacterium sp. AK22]EXJ22427.1 Chromosome replication initiation protein DnaD [Alkalibacterium sp. AK22]